MTALCFFSSTLRSFCHRPIILCWGCSTYLCTSASSHVSLLLLDMGECCFLPFELSHVSTAHSTVSMDSLPVLSTTHDMETAGDGVCESFSFTLRSSLLGLTFVHKTVPPTSSIGEYAHGYHRGDAPAVAVPPETLDGHHGAPDIMSNSSAPYYLFYFLTLLKLFFRSSFFFWHWALTRFR